jgi:hypothetical protein
MLCAQMRKEIEAGRWRGQDKEAAAAAENSKQGQKPVPKPYMSGQYREDAMRTTGLFKICWVPLGTPCPLAAIRVFEPKLT